MARGVRVYWFPMKIIVDEEIRALIPEMSVEERDNLEEEIEEDGEIREAVIVWKEQSILLDGHNRKEISEATGKKLRVAEISLPDRDSAKAWVIRHQLARRNLTDYQRGQMALKLKPILAKQAAERRSRIPESSKTTKIPENTTHSVPANLPEQKKTGEETNAIIAGDAGLSRKTIDKIESIEKSASEPLKKLAESGAVSIDAAAKVATLPKKQQSTIARAGPGAVKKAAKELREGKPDAPLLDKFGDPVPKELTETFKNAERFDQALSMLTQVMKIVNPLMGDPKTSTAPIPGGEFVSRHRQEFESFIKNARNILTFGRPHAPCPYPHRGGKCEVCLNLGWAVYMSWHNIPPEYLKGHQKQNGKAVAQ